MALKTDIEDLKPSFRVSRKDDNGEWWAVQYNSYLQPDFPLSAFSFARSQMGGCGAGTITSLTPLNVEYGDMVELWIMGDMIYSGFVEDIPKVGSQHQFEYVLRGWQEQLGWSYCRGLEFSYVKIGAAIIQLLEEYIFPRTDIKDDISQVDIDYATLAQDGWDGMISSLYFDRQTPADVLNVLGDMAGSDYEWGVDETRTFYFRKKSTDVEYRWVEGVGEVGEFYPDEDSDRVRNWLWLSCGRLSDGSDFILEVHDDDSIAERGRREEWYTMPSSLPYYDDQDACQYGDGATATPINLDSATGEEYIFDDDPTTCFDSGEEQLAGVALHCKFEDTASITNPNRGHGGSLVGTPTYAAGKFGNGIVTSLDNYCRFPTESNRILFERGSVTFWWKWPDNANDITDNLVFWDFIDPSNGGNQLMFNGTLHKFVLRGTRRGDQYIRTVYSPTVTDMINNTALVAADFQSGALVHVAVSWDQYGKILPPQVRDEVGKNVQVTALLRINNILVAYHTKTWLGARISGWMNVGSDYAGENPAGGVIDNLKTWETPIGKFPEYDTEDSAEDIQGIRIDLPERDGSHYWNLAKIRLNSAADDNSSNYARGYKIECLTGEDDSDTGDWLEVYRTESTSTADSTILFSPTVCKAFKISLLRFAEETWKIFGIEAYEFNEDDVLRYGTQQLNTMKSPSQSAKLTLTNASSVPLPRGKCTVRSRQFVDYTYDVASIEFNSSGRVVNLTLGDIPLTLDKQMRELQRQILLNQYRSDAIAADIASGDGMKNDSVDYRAIGAILAEQVISGSLSDIDGVTIEDGLIEIRDSSDVVKVGLGNLTDLSGVDFGMYLVGKIGIDHMPVSSSFKITGDSDAGLMLKGTFGSGLTLPVSGAGTRCFWYPRKAAFRAGRVTSTQWDDANIGNYSFAEGYNVTASGLHSQSRGDIATASGDYSFAYGNTTTASGDYSFAYGNTTTASGDYSFAYGNTTTASGDYSFAYGNTTTASGTVSFAYGYATIASGDYSFAYGINVTASGTVSFAYGYKAIISCNWNSLGSFSRYNDDNADYLPVEYSEPKQTAFDTEKFKVLDSNETDSEMVSNGGFADATDWNVGTGWAISGGKANRTANATLGTLNQDISAATGKAYLVKFTVSGLTTAGVYAKLGTTGTAGRTITADGTYYQILIAAGVSLYFYPTAAASAFSIDNVSCAEIDAGEFYAGGTITANRGYKVSGSGVGISTGATGTFTDNDGNTVTVKGGIITALT